MDLLLTGANGYIGTRLLTTLAEAGHRIHALVRSRRRLAVPPHLEDRIRVVEGDLLDPDTLDSIPKRIEAAYYLVHSMGQRASGFAALEARCAENFNAALAPTRVRQTIYLGGLAPDRATSEHLDSRRRVEDILAAGPAPVTVLRAGIIIGAGSASFEIIRDLVEKLPVMVSPRWVRSRCQPIGLADILFYLEGVLDHPECLGRTFDLGGADVLTYREMLLRFARRRGLRRWILTVPVLTPGLSSLWLFFITATNFNLARALVRSLMTDAVCTEDSVHRVLPHRCLTYDEAVGEAFARIEQNAVVSSWKDAMVRSELQPKLLAYIEVPSHGCLKETVRRTGPVPRAEVLDRLWCIGGRNRWYWMNWAWTLRGLLDQLCGGVGLRRGRTHPTRLRVGDALDFWRVLVADREAGHLLLYAEMRLPGEAWLEWRVVQEVEGTTLTQVATFRPRGVLGRLYWYSLVPIHGFIFRGLARRILLG